MTAVERRVRRRGQIAIAALALAMAAVTGCGSASDPHPPAGVDELVIPTPTPDPADFVEVVSNPWFPLAEGARWRYEESPGGREVTVTVVPGPRIAGVPTTTLRSRTTNDRGRRVAESVDHYAEDREGNVWWFGHTGAGNADWRVGEDGAQAGLAMPARPRVGDGYREALAPDVLEPWSRVDTLDRRVEVPAGEYDGALLVETTYPLGDRVVRSVYVSGLGLVQRDVAAGTPQRELGLVAYDEPQR